MYEYLKTLEKNLSDDDRRILGDIYAPRVVAVQPEDTRVGLCVCPDGELRSYGKRFNEKRDCYEEIYLSSWDCGLSWKTFYAKGELGSCVRSPYSGRYLAVRSDRNGTYAFLSETGPTDISPRKYKITDKCFYDLFPPYAMKSRKRWLCTMHAEEDGIQYPYVMSSDDDGESWRIQRLETTPPHIYELPHLGVRWENRGAEPTLTEAPDGTLILLMRTSHEYIYICYSYNGGDSWTQPKPSTFHATLTTPAWLCLSDGRIIIFWCNTQPLPELDHDKQWPPVDYNVKKGIGEDVFTNRDANHAAISEDGGKTWIGFREIYLNVIRNNADFRLICSRHNSLDKSVQQFQALQLPFNKVLLQFGQNTAARKSVIFDIDWLYEKSRREDFQDGLVNVSTQVYVTSFSGCSAAYGYKGHCAWNRTNGALLVPSPDLDHREVLQLAHIKDKRLFSGVQGAVWNYPASYRGSVRISLRIEGEGIRISLTDRWFNPIDTTIDRYAQFSFIIDGEQIQKSKWTEILINFNIDEDVAGVYADGLKLYSLNINGTCVNGLSYLHLLTIAQSEDYKGTLIRSLYMEDDKLQSGTVSC